MSRSFIGRSLLGRNASSVPLLPNAEDKCIKKSSNTRSARFYVRYRGPSPNDDASGFRGRVGWSGRTAASAAGSRSRPANSRPWLPSGQAFFSQSLLDCDARSQVASYGLEDSDKWGLTRREGGGSSSTAPSTLVIAALSSGCASETMSLVPRRLRWASVRRNLIVCVTRAVGTGPARYG